MTTPLRKPVRRRTEFPFDHRGRRLICTLEPGDIISIREERCRLSVEESISAVYSWMVGRHVERARREKRKVNKRKAGG